VSKVLKTLLVAAVALGVAAPAMAEFKLNGQFRIQGYNQELLNVLDEEGDSQQFIDQRLRLKGTYTLNDRVSVVYWGEVDTVWGVASKGGIGGGGKLGADGVNVETKNAYATIKFPEAKYTLTAGIQGLKDNFEGIVFWDDMAAFAVTGPAGPVDLTLVYSKWDESTGTEAGTIVNGAPFPAGTSDWDDFDFYAVHADTKFSDSLKGGAAVYFLDRNNFDGTDTADFEAWYAGLNADARFGNFGLKGFVLYQNGEIDTDGGVDVDTEALAASVKGSMVIPNGDVGLRLIYFSEDDDDDDFGGWIGNVGAFDFVYENLGIFLTDIYVNNAAKERYAMIAAQNGFGLFGAVLSGNHKLPSDYYVKWGAGYFTALTDDVDDDGTEEVAGEDLGYELAAQVGRKFAEKVDVSLRGNYASFGDFFDGIVAGGKDPDDIFKVVAMLSVDF
jgi:hypothetical protein